VRRSRLAALILLAGAGAALGGRLEIARDYVRTRIMGRNKTIADRLAEYGEAVKERLGPDFARAGVAYPPSELVLAVFKDEKVLHLYAAGPGGALKHVRRYSVLAASGVLGPKLREGDDQVPEGLYRVESLNPNSLFHLSLRVGYPNEFDRAQARKDGRTKLGGDIMIHGNAVSIGCVAIGDEGAEDLFVLAARTGIERVRVILSPVDFRRAPAPTKGLPPWTPELYKTVAAEVAKLPR